MVALRIPGAAIDDDAARGLGHAAGTAAPPPSGFRLLLGSRPLLIFALCCAMFHLANAAMLPLAGQKLALIDPGLAAIAILPLRGVLYALSHDPCWLVAVQLLDGVGAGLFGALFPLVVADLTRDAGHFNLAQGAITTAQGVGASASPAIAGLIVVDAGYSAAFLALAAVAAVALLLFWSAMPETLRRPAPAPLPATART